MDSRRGHTELTIKFGSVDYETPNEAATKLKETRKAIAGRYSELVAAQNFLNEDQTLNGPERLVKLSKLAENRAKWTYERIAEAREIADKALSLHNERINKLYEMPQNASLEMRHRDMRNWIARMPLHKRVEFVRESLLAKREDVLAAICTAPRELSDVLIPHYNEARVLLAQLKAPDDFSAVQTITQEMNSLDDAERNFDAAVMEEFVRPGLSYEIQQEQTEKLLKEI